MSKSTAAEDQAPEQLDLDTQASADQGTPDNEPENPIEEARDYLAKGGSKAAAQEDDEHEEHDDGEDDGEAGEGGEDQGEGDEHQPGDQDDEADDPEEDLAAMPEAVRERTRQRFEKLNQGYQELQQAHETLASDHNTIVSAIAEAGMDSQQFSQVLDYVSAINSSDPKDLEYARSMLTAQLEDINLRLGDEDTLLNGHPDLQEAVDNLELTREHAVELAKSRTQQQRAQSGQQQQPQQRQAPQQPAPTSDVTPDMVQRLNDLGTSWQKSDLAFDKKWPVLMDRLPALYERTRPEALEQAVRDEWERIGKELAKPSTTARRGQRRQRPLSSGGAGAQGAVDHKDPVAGARAYLDERFSRS